MLFGVATPRRYLASRVAGAMAQRRVGAVRRLGSLRFVAPVPGGGSAVGGPVPAGTRLVRVSVFILAGKGDFVYCRRGHLRAGIFPSPAYGILPTLRPAHASSIMLRKIPRTLSPTQALMSPALALSDGEECALCEEEIRRLKSELQDSEG